MYITRGSCCRKYGQTNGKVYQNKQKVNIRLLFLEKLLHYMYMLLKHQHFKTFKKEDELFVLSKHDKKTRVCMWMKPTLSDKCIFTYFVDLNLWQSFSTKLSHCLSFCIKENKYLKKRAYINVHMTCTHTLRQLYYMTQINTRTVCEKDQLTISCPH